MPTVTVVRDSLYEAIGRTFTTEQFEDLCFQIGLELDGEEIDQSGHTLFHIAVGANRYDLLCLEGIALALSVFIGQATTPQYRVLDDIRPLRIKVHSSVSKVRPYMLSAVLRNITFTNASYASFIDLQEKLHRNICRKRTLASVGAHDLDSIQGPFSYEGIVPSDFSFIPLNQTKSVDGHGMIELLEDHHQLKQYLHLVRDQTHFPVFLDANRVVCSAPPIINSEHSKITVHTRNVLLDVTAIDRTKAHIVLNTLVTAFSKYCDNPFSIEPVIVEYEKGHIPLSGTAMKLPNLETRQMELSVHYARDLAGIPQLSPVSVVELLKKMMIDAEVIKSNEKESDTVRAYIGAHRSDVLHPCDLVEDVAVAYGYGNIRPVSHSSINPLHINDITEKLCEELAMAGYHECQNWALISCEETFKNLRREPLQMGSASEEITNRMLDEAHYIIATIPVRIATAKTKEFEMARTTLLPGLLKSLYAHQHMELPIRLFEVGDCVRRDTTNRIGSSNLRCCAALMANKNGSGLEEVHGLLDLILGGFKLYGEYTDVAKADTTVQTFKLVEYDDPIFLAGRAVKIIKDTNNEKVCVGIMGVFHPDVLKAYCIPVPASAFEFSIDYFLKKLT